MKSFIFLVLTVLTTTAYCQQDGTTSDSSLNLYADSTAVHSLNEKYSASKQLMVSFTQGCTADLTDFWTFLLCELHYKTDKPNVVNLQPAKDGLIITFSKYGEGYRETIKSLMVNLVCSRNGNNLKSAIITGDKELLAEIYTSYFEGTIKQPGSSKMDTNVTNTLTDEIRLIANKIIILPLHNHFGM